MSDNCIFLKIREKEANAVMEGIETLKELFSEQFSQVFKTITSDNGSEFKDNTRGRNTPSEQHLPRQRGCGGTRHGPQRSGARTRDYDTRKKTSLYYKGIKINIVDTPGHADFGGEVERSIRLVDGVLLLVDAIEGCMPQTRFVLKKALALNLKPIIVVSKADRPMARPYEVVDEVLSLFLNLGATEEQFDSPIIFASSRDGWASFSFENPSKDLTDLFELIVKHIPAPSGDKENPFQMLVSNIDYNEYSGRIAIGRIERGIIRSGDQAVICRRDGSLSKVKISNTFTYEGLKNVLTDEVRAGEIAAISGLGYQTYLIAQSPD